MKKLLSAILCTGMVLALSACGSTTQPSSSTVGAPAPSSTASSQAAPASSTAPESSSASVSSASTTDTTPAPQSNKTLVVYFSLPETTKTEGLTEDEENSVVVVDGEALGNTQYVAYLIAENTGADLFRIEPKTPYTTEHDALTDLAKQEQNQKARPELLANVENLSQYDTIFVGYPNWWGDMPMILYTFFDENDFSGKTIIPFNTHGGSGFSSTIGTITELEPNATINQEGFTVSRGSVQDVEPDIISWLSGLGY